LEKLSSFNKKNILTSKKENKEELKGSKKEKINILLL
jgi:hypothetical protein